MAAPIRMVGGTATSGAFRLDLDEKSLARGRKLLDHYQGKPLGIRMDKAALAAARVMEAPMRAAAPSKTGRMRKSTRARQFPRSGRPEPHGASVGPTVGYRHLVIQGHRIVTHLGRDTGKRSRSNPYVDAVARRLGPRAIASMRRYIFDTEYGRVL